MSAKNKLLAKDQTIRRNCGLTGMDDYATVLLLQWTAQKIARQKHASPLVVLPAQHRGQVSSQTTLNVK